MQQDIQGCLSSPLAFLFEKAVNNRVFPGAAVAVSQGKGIGRQHFFSEYGFFSYDKKRSELLHRGAFFDLASLTKPLATALSVLHLCSLGTIALDDRLDDLLEEDIRPPLREITLRHLLCHSSGLPAYQLYFKNLGRLPPEERKNTLKNKILAEPLSYETGRASLYSDLGFLLLGFIVEKNGKMPLDRYSREYVFKPLALDDAIFFQRPSSGQKMKNCVPTEYCAWRKRTICGEVHDENAYCLDGVAGHAGLFGNTVGLLSMFDSLLDAWRQRTDFGTLNGEKIRQFLQRQDVPESTWALGFDTPSDKNSSSGQYLSPTSVGHLGFTGTSFWIDPERELVVVLLTNRVHPDRRNTKIRRFRPLLHDLIVEELDLV